MDLKMGAYKKALDTHMTTQLKEAVGAWIQAAITEIPVWSGASHGTFIKLASKIGVTFAVPAAGGFPGMNGPSYGNAKSQGRFTSFSGAYVAEYNTTLWHLCYNEYNDANANPVEARLFARLKKATPYYFQVKAGKVFEDNIKKVRMPSPWAFLTLNIQQVS